MHGYTGVARLLWNPELASSFPPQRSRRSSRRTPSPATPSACGWRTFGRPRRRGATMTMYIIAIPWHIMACWLGLHAHHITSHRVANLGTPSSRLTASHLTASHRLLRHSTHIATRPAPSLCRYPWTPSAAHWRRTAGSNSKPSSSSCRIKGRAWSIQIQVKRTEGSGRKRGDMLDTTSMQPLR